MYIYNVIQIISNYLKICFPEIFSNVSGIRNVLNNFNTVSVFLFSEEAIVKIKFLLYFCNSLVLRCEKRCQMLEILFAVVHHSIKI